MSVQFANAAATACRNASRTPTSSGLTADLQAAMFTNTAEAENSQRAGKKPKLNSEI
jgi:hypothetical protein